MIRRGRIAAGKREAVQAQLKARFVLLCQACADEGGAEPAAGQQPLVVQQRAACEACGGSANAASARRWAARVRSPSS